VSRYRIRAVAELTGVSTATLRAWERRYGVPTPSRTASAYRLYGDDDVALVAQMRDLVESGVAPAEAARALRDHAAGAVESIGEADAYQATSDRILDAVQRFDVEGLRREVTRSLALGPAIAIFERALAPALKRVGELWLEGKITVAQEHVLSNILLGRVNQLVELLQPVDASRRVALGCFETEDHVLGLHGVALHFAAWGYRSVFLGARTPPAEVARVVATLKVDAVALSVTIPPPPAQGRALVEAYADACRGAVWLVGGQGIGDMRQSIQARGGIVGDAPFSEIRRALDKAVRADNSQDPGSAEEPGVSCKTPAS
jgi:DNA-binding transcriptional MerR regulator/methylmalonyl-CoA mutase cobalamin-binding subunit